nr:hypothetical protein [uncultured Sphingomonas sp.]
MHPSRLAAVLVGLVVPAGGACASAAHSLAAQMIANAPRSQAPPSFNGDPTLFAWNLFLMTAGMFLGFMLSARQAQRIWAQRVYDHPLHPVTLYRGITFLAAVALMIRCGTEALNLWGWNPADPATYARVVMAKRWLDPVALGCGLSWMAIVVLGEPGIEYKLRSGPLPVDMWSRWPVLARAAGIVLLSGIIAAAAVLLR